VIVVKVLKKAMLHAVAAGLTMDISAVEGKEQ